jgi:hypothetical protein
MKSTKLRSYLSRIAFIAGLASCAAASADPLPIPIPGTCGVGSGTNCLTFTDFNVFSLTLLNLAAGGQGAPTGNDPYNYPSTYGAINQFVIVGINNGQSGPAQGTGTQIDAAYNTPSANNVSTFTDTTTDTSGAPVGDANSWQASLDSLRTAIGDQSLLAFFAFNETGKSETGLPEGPDLLIWARATLSDADPSNGTTASESFYLQPNGSTLALTPPSLAANDLPASNVDPNTGNTGVWAYVHGAICVDAGGQFLGIFPDANGDCPTGQHSVAQTNTGQNNASFAIYSPILDALVHDATNGFTTLTIDFELAYINGGGETLWLQGANMVPTQVPEPNALLLLGVALLSLGAVRYARKG